MAWLCPGAVCRSPQPGAAPPSTALLVHGAQKGVLDTGTRAWGQRRQLPAVLPAFLWDNGLRESGKFLSDCRSIWWKGNF